MSKEVTDNIKALVDNLADLDNTEEMINAITDSVLKDEANPNNNVSDDYKIGYNTGFVDGYQEGVIISQTDEASTIYNEAIDDIINVIDSYEFDVKEELTTIINQLRRA